MRTSVLLLVLAYIYVLVDVAKSEPRLIGGQNAVRHQFPYVVSIRLGSTHLSGGSIISSSWVISSARWYEGNSNMQFTIIAGVLNQNEQNAENQARNSSKIVIYPGYEFLSLDNDIALIKVDTPFVFTEAVKAIDLHCNQADLQIGRDIWTAGWGSTSYNGTASSITLQFLKTSLLTWQECNKLVGDTANITDRMVCSFPEQLNQGGCWNDEGNPLVQNDVLVGIKIGERQLRCNPETTERIPYVATGIHPYLRFIVDTIGEPRCGFSPPSSPSDDPDSGISAAPSFVFCLITAFGAVLYSR